MRHAVLAHSIYQTFAAQNEAKCNPFRRDDFWKHAVAVGCCAELLAGELAKLWGKDAEVDPFEAFMGPEFAKWYASGGRLGREPTDPNLRKILELFRGAAAQKDDERNKTAQEIWKILVDQQYSIGTVGQSPALMGVRLVSRKLGNIPSRVCIAQHCRTPRIDRIGAHSRLNGMIARVEECGSAREIGSYTSIQGRRRIALDGGKVNHY